MYLFLQLKLGLQRQVAAGTSARQWYLMQKWSLLSGFRSFQSHPQKKIQRVTSSPVPSNDWEVVRRWKMLVSPQRSPKGPLRNDPASCFFRMFDVVWKDLIHDSRGRALGLCLIQFSAPILVIRCSCGTLHCFGNSTVVALCVVSSSTTYFALYGSALRCSQKNRLRM